MISLQPIYMPMKGSCTGCKVSREKVMHMPNQTIIIGRESDNDAFWGLPCLNAKINMKFII